MKSYPNITPLITIVTSRSHPHFFGPQTIYSLLSSEQDYQTCQQPVHKITNIYRGSYELLMLLITVWTVVNTKEYFFDNMVETLITVPKQDMVQMESSILPTQDVVDVF